MNQIEIQTKYLRLGIGQLPDSALRAAMEQRGEAVGSTSEKGTRLPLNRQISALYQQMWVDPALRQSIMDIRSMDRSDGRVKKIHGRIARTAVKGGLMLKKSTSKRIRRQFDQYIGRLGLHNQEKLESDARGLVMEGNLPMQWVMNEAHRVVAGIRMPTETMQPKVGRNGRFKDPRAAYEQRDLATGKTIATFPLWQLTLCRLSPDNYDDMGSMGRPYLDASRTVWNKLVMTEEDLVIRRRVRAPLRLAHILEGASKDDLENYRSDYENEQGEVTTDFYLNKKGGVQAVQGDANLDQIADVSYLLDTFFAGTPAPKGLFGYAEKLSRDVLDDMKKDYFEEIDALQDTLAGVYQAGFELDLLLQGIVPNPKDVKILFKERRTETPNQAADRALKLKALGASTTTAWQTALLDPDDELDRLSIEKSSRDPYPRPDQITPAGGSGRVTITPGNARKGESATSIANK